MHYQQIVHIKYIRKGRVLSFNIFNMLKALGVDIHGEISTRDERIYAVLYEEENVVIV
jgi:hypothetical protein